MSNTNNNATVTTTPATTTRVRRDNRISRTRAIALIEGVGGRFFNVTYLKNDGTVRTLNCKKGTGIAKDELGYYTVYSTQDKGYRKINLRELQSISISGVTYKIRHSY